MSIATLSIDLVARVANIERDMGRAANIAARNARRMERAFRGVSMALRTLGVGVSVSGLAALARNTANTADALAKLSQRTGVAVEDLSRLQYAARMSGVEHDVLETGLRRLNVAIAEASNGTGRAGEAFRALGIEVRNQDGTLRNAKDVFEDFAEQISKYDDGAAKSALVTRVFGQEVGSRLVPQLNLGRQGLRDMARESDNLGNTISTKLAQQAQDFNDNMERLQTLSRSVGIEIGSFLIPKLNQLAEQFLASRRAGLQWWEAMVGIGLSNPLKGPAEHLATINEELMTLERRRRDALAWVGGRAEASATIPLLDRRIEFLQKQQAYWLEMLGVGQTQAAPQQRGAAPLMAPETTAPSGRARTVISEQQRIFEAIQRQIGALELQAATFGKTEREATLYRFAVEGATEAQIESANAILQTIESMEERFGLERRAKEIYEQTRAPLELLNREIAELNMLLEKGVIDWDTYARAMFDAQDRVAAMGEKIEEVAEKLDVFAEQAARNIQGALADFLFNPFDRGLEGMLQSFQNTLQRMIAEAVAADLARKLFGGLVGGEGTGLLGGFMSTVFGGARAAGGPVMPGRAYLVGEKGPELIVPRAAGQVVPNHKLTGGGTVVQHMSFYGASDPQAVKRAAGAGAREAIGLLGRAQRYA